MGYYHIHLRKQVSNLCTLTLLWGKYMYKHLTMVLSKYLVIFQEKMNEMFLGF